MRIVAVLAALALAAPLSGHAPAEHPTTTPIAAAASVSTTDDFPPIIVVLDLSGSMNDDDGTGLIKLTGAKKAVNDVIRSIPASQSFGLWTYPGGSDSCTSGMLAVPPAPISDIVETTRRVDALIADGRTPTGPALQSAADALRQRGVGEATFVLVSDGESNCGEDPCEVARNLLVDGFQVTIRAVGFRVSEVGREQLQCVASVTGGTYVDVTDSAQLSATLRDLTRARLRVEVSGTLEPLPGTPARITVRVSNASGVNANDTRIALQFDEPQATDGNTLMRIGNVLPASAVERTWTIGNDLSTMYTPVADPQRGRSFTISAWATNADRVTASASLGGQGAASAGDAAGSYRDDLGDVLSVPLDAGHPIVILGDSYSSGEGTFDYEEVSSPVSQNCHRSNRTYLGPVLDPGDVVNLACSGAVSTDLAFSSATLATVGTPAQLAQLARLEQTPGAVVMTVGGNDIGFAAIVTQCVKTKIEAPVPDGGYVGGCDKSAAQVAGWENAADQMRSKLEPVFESVWGELNRPDRRADRDGAYAPVIVLAYPQLTHATKFGACGIDFGAGEVRVANGLAAHLNAAIKAAVADARAKGFEVYFVPDTADVALPDHTVCDRADSYFNGVVDFGSAPESFHPNVSGYAAESAAIVQWSQTMTRLEPITSQVTSSRAVESFVTDFVQGTLDLDDLDASSKALLNGEILRVTGSGYAPGTVVTTTLHSTPVPLGTFVADDEGRIDGRVRIPDGTPLGQHLLITSGLDADGIYREDSVEVSVVVAPPIWVLAALPVSAVLLLAAIVFAVVWRRARRSEERRTALNA